MAYRITITSFAAIIVLFLGMLSHVESFTVRPLPSTAATSPSSLRMTTLVYNGKKKDFKPGSPLSKAMAQLGVPVKYSCKKGDCATCQVTVAGRYMRACTGKVPEEPKLKSLQEKGLEVRV